MFSDQEYQRQEGAGARANEPLLQHWINLGFNFMFLEMRVMIGASVHRFGVWKEVYMVIGKSRRRQGMWCLIQGSKFSDEGVNFRKKLGCVWVEGSFVDIMQIWKQALAPSLRTKGRSWGGVMRWREESVSPFNSTMCSSRKNFIDTSL